MIAQSAIAIPLPPSSLLGASVPSLACSSFLSFALSPPPPKQSSGREAVHMLTVVSCFRLKSLPPKLYRQESSRVSVTPASFPTLGRWSAHSSTLMTVSAVFQASLTSGSALRGRRDTPPHGVSARRFHIVDILKNKGRPACRRVARFPKGA